ncbi:MAG TPA: GFA family protein [Acidimicrobiales bacterium]
MGYCHCISCQRWSGSCSLPFVVTVPEHFRVVRGQELVAHYRDDRTTVRAFCRYCGSSLYQDTGSSYLVAAGILHDLKLVPALHIHTSQKAVWEHIDGDAPQFEELPSASAAAGRDANRQTQKITPIVKPEREGD